jgi:prepilin peptidase CpaA
LSICFRRCINPIDMPKNSLGLLALIKYITSSRRVLQLSGTALVLLVLQLGCVGMILAACLHDVVARTIPNGLVLALAAVGITTATIGGHFLGSFLAAGGVFIVSAVMWRRGWMGGGDVKLLGASTLGLAPGVVLPFIAAVAIAGGVLGVLYLGARLLVAAPAHVRPIGLFARAVRVERWRIGRGGPLPYACAIAAGVLFVTISGSVS